jgi:hypothetical protein
MYACDEEIDYLLLFLLVVCDLDYFASRTAVLQFLCRIRHGDVKRNCSFCSITLLILSISVSPEYLVIISVLWIRNDFFRILHKFVLIFLT